MILGMKYIVLSLAFLIPCGLVFADTTGFAEGSVWVSHTPIVEGETVLIHAALTNGSDTKLTGTVVFKDNSKAIGSIPFTLESGEARIVSLSWKATAGSHSLTASIEKASDAGAAQTQTLDVSVASKEIAVPISTPAKKDNAAAVAFTNAKPLEDAIGSVSPKAEEITKPVFTTLDSFRKSAGEVLGAQTSATEAKVASLSAQKKKLTAENTPAATSEGRKVSAYQIFNTVLLYIYEVLLVIVSSAGYFYPVFFFLFFFILYKIFQRIRRPNYDY